MRFTVVVVACVFGASPSSSQETTEDPRLSQAKAECPAVQALTDGGVIESGEKNPTFRERCGAQGEFCKTTSRPERCGSHASGFQNHVILAHIDPDRNRVFRVDDFEIQLSANMFAQAIPQCEGQFAYLDRCIFSFSSETSAPADVTIALRDERLSETRTYNLGAECQDLIPMPTGWNRLLRFMPDPVGDLNFLAVFTFPHPQDAHPDLYCFSGWQK